MSERLKGFHQQPIYTTIKMVIIIILNILNRILSDKIILTLFCSALTPFHRQEQSDLSPPLTHQQGYFPFPGKHGPIVKVNRAPSTPPAPCPPLPLPTNLLFFFAKHYYKLELFPSLNWTPDSNKVALL